MSTKKFDIQAVDTQLDALQDSINNYKKNAEELYSAYEMYIMNDTHRGDTADAAKAYMADVEMGLLNDIIELQQLLFDINVHMYNSFQNTVDHASNAKIEVDAINEVFTDFKQFSKDFEESASAIEIKATSVVENFGHLADFTIPNFSATRDTFTEVVGDEVKTGFLQECINKFEAFDSEAIAYEKSKNFKERIEAISKKITENDIKLDNVQLLNPAVSLFEVFKLMFKDVNVATEKFLSLLSSMRSYLLGKEKKCTVCEYDPVNMCNGNYIHDHVDILIGGRYPIEFKRFYNAKSEKIGSLGMGWTHSFEIHVNEDKTSEKLTINYGDGSSGSFVKHGDYFIEEHGEPGILHKLSDGYLIKQDSGVYQKFDCQGYLVSIGHVEGNNTFISYETLSNGIQRIKKLETKNKSCLEFAYFEEGANAGFIKTVTDHTGRAVCYSYDDKRLVEIKEPDGAIRRLSYTENGKIKDVINPRGIVTVTNEFDSSNRTVKQSFPDGSEMTYEYDDKCKTTTATEQNGNKVVYTHDELERHIKTIYYDGEESYTYNFRNQKISYTDKCGNTTRFAYDNKGHLTKIVDALGNKTSITYRADGKPMATKGARGEEYRYYYNADGRLSGIKNPLNETSRFYYKSGNVVKTINALGAATLLGYDDRGNVNTIIDPDGVVVEYKYDELNRVAESKTADGAVTKYEYDEANRLRRTIDALGNTREYTYDLSGNVISVKEKDDTVTSFEVNVMGRVSKVVDGAGNITEITYNTMGKQEKVLLPNGGIIKYEYDLLMRLTKVTDPEGIFREYEYDANGNVIAEYICGKRVRTLKYDAVNRITKEIDALGNEKNYEYNENGQVISVVDKLGNKSTRDYDLLGRVIKEVDVLGNEISYTYTKLGDVESITDASGRVRRFEYTDGGKLKTIIFCDSLEQQLSYDNLGRVVERSFADGYKISYSYDVLSRIEKVEASDGRSVEYEYDAMGRATRLKDGESTTYYTYTETGRLKSVVDALGNETAYTYDSLDNLKSINKAEGRIEAWDRERLPVVGNDGHVTLYAYNLSGQLTTVTDALAQKETYEYDQYGRLVAKNDKDGYRTSYEYDLANQVSAIKYADGRSVELSYDALGRLIQFKDWLGTTSVERDALGRTLAVIDYNGKKVSYSYGKNSERTSITYPDGKKVDYIYDDKLRLSQLVCGSDKTSYAYDEFDRLVEKQLPNANREVMNYLPGGYLRSLELFDNKGTLDKYVYSYDKQGNRTEIDRKRRDLNNISGKYSYEYDLENRLTQVSLNGNPLRSYSYDAFGNRRTLIENESITKYTYDVLDRLCETIHGEETKTFSYDKRGNQTSISVNGKITKAFTFDATNMLVKASDSQKGEATYSYNGVGQRVVAVNPEERIEYLLDLTKDYHNMLERTVNGETEVYTYDSNIVSMSKSGYDNFYMLDELGTGMYLTGTDGMVTSTYAYDEFGRNVNPFTGGKERYSYTKENNIIQPLAFTGYQRDDFTDSYYAQARYYDADAGRFISRDSAKYVIKSVPNTHNIYAYCGNNGIRNIDPDGHESIVVSGGPANTDEFKYQFVETAIKDMRDQIAGGTNPKDITWVIMNAGYSDTDIANFKDTASKLGVNIVESNGTDDLIDYLNTKNGGRAQDLITDMSFYCHGRTPKRVDISENELSFAYHIEDINSDEFAFKQSDIAKLNSAAFDNTVTYFYSCNAGTSASGAENSFAQDWSNKTGGKSWGLKNARSLYSFINCTGDVYFYTGFVGGKAFAPLDYWNWAMDKFGWASDEWKEKQLRHDRDTNGKGYSEYGSLNYPIMVSMAGDLDGYKDFFDRGWCLFEAEKCDD